MKIKTWLAMAAGACLMFGCVTTSGSSLGNFSYEPAGEVLTVRFEKGGAYEYTGVPSDLYDQIVSSDSPGSTFNELVKGKFPSRKLAE